MHQNPHFDFTLPHIPTSEEHIDFQHEIKEQRQKTTFYFFWICVFKWKSRTTNKKNKPWFLTWSVSCSKLNKNVAPTQTYKAWRDLDINKLFQKLNGNLIQEKKLIFLWLCKCFAAQDKQPHVKHKTKDNDWKSFKSPD